MTPLYTYCVAREVVIFSLIRLDESSYSYGGIWILDVIMLSCSFAKGDNPEVITLYFVFEILSYFTHLLGYLKLFASLQLP